MNRYKFNSPVLDVGCGTGETLELISKGYDAEGIDLSGEAVSVCRNKGLNVAGTDLFDFNKKFNSIICTDVLEHIEDDNRFIKHLYGILNKRGKLFILVPSGKMMKDDLLHGHYRRYSRGSIIELLKKNDFIIESVEMWGYPIIYFIRRFMNFINRLEPGEDTNIKIQTGKSSYESPFDGSIFTRAYTRITQYPLMSKIAAKILLTQNLFAKGNRGLSVIVIAKKP